MNLTLTGFNSNGTKATTIEVDLDTLSGDWIYFYVNRSLDSSIRGGGATGYKFTINGIEYIHTFSNLGRLNFKRRWFRYYLGYTKKCNVKFW